MNTKEITPYSKMWLEELGLLNPISPKKLYRVVGPLVTGIELDSRPGTDSYTVFVTMYGLWHDNMKDCLKFPIIFENLHDTKGVQMLLYERGHDNRFQEALLSLRQRYGRLVEGDFSLDDALLYCDQYIHGDRLSGSPNSYFVALVFEAMVSLCTSVLAIERAAEIYELASKVNWNEDNFKAFKVKVSDWKNGLEMQLNNPDILRANVTKNRHDPQLRRMNIVEMRM